MSWLSKIVNKVLPGSPSREITKAMPYVAPFVAGPALGLLGGALGVAVPGGVAGSILSGATTAALGGGNVGQGAMMGALGGLLPKMPGDIGKFFQSDAGQALISTFGYGAGGDISQLGGILDEFGLTGKQKDVAEELLTLAALSAFSNKFAKDALNKAKEYETYEQEAVKGLMATAESMRDPKTIEQNVQKALEGVTKEYTRAEQETEKNLYARGLGLRMPGQEARINAEEAAARMQARRDIESQAQMNALQAQTMAMGPMQDLAGRLRSQAEAERALPFQLYGAYKEANKKSPLEDYLAAQLAMQQAPMGYGQPQPQVAAPQSTEERLREQMANLMPTTDWIKSLGTIGQGVQSGAGQYSSLQNLFSGGRTSAPVSPIMATLQKTPLPTLSNPYQNWMVKERQKTQQLPLSFKF